MKEFAGKVAVVTGGGQGIGRAFAERFSAEGAAVVVADRNGDAAATAAEKINAGGGRAQAATVDVTDPAAVGRVVGETVDRWGRLDVLVNNAAIFSTITMKPFGWSRIGNGPPPMAKPPRTAPKTITRPAMVNMGTRPRNPYRPRRERT